MKQEPNTSTLRRCKKLEPAAADEITFSVGFPKRLPERPQRVTVHLPAQVRPQASVEHIAAT